MVQTVVRLGMPPTESIPALSQFAAAFRSDGRMPVALVTGLLDVVPLLPVLPDVVPLLPVLPDVVPVLPVLPDVVPTTTGPLDGVSVA